MQPFTRLTGVAAPINQRNVNTDMLFPARFMRKMRGGGYQDYLFRDLRFTPQGEERTDFMLNRAPYRPAKIFVADTNFGCGSSREGAVYALADYGIRALIAPSFGDIFAANCVANGLLIVRLDEQTTARIRRQLEHRPGSELTIDLATQTLADAEGQSHHFDIAASDKECLLQGVDEIDLTLRYVDRIDEFEDRARVEYDWLFVSLS